MAKILLVDDDVSLQTLYGIALRNAGHTVSVAGDGQSGLEFVAVNNVDLILLDLRMPRIGGIEFLESYNIGSHVGVKLIILTNMSDIELLNRAMELGASNYINKSDVTPKKMIEIVNNVLNDSAA